MRFGLPVIIISFFATAVFLSGCGKKSSDILVGVNLSLTGQTADFGITTRQGIELAADEINASGGIKGKKITLVIEDNRGKPEESRTAVTRLIDQAGVICVIGDVASSNSLTAAPVCQARKIPMISPSSTNEVLTKKGDYIFRVCFIDPFQGYVMAKFATDTLKKKRAAVLWDNGSDYSKGLADVFKNEFLRMGGQIVGDLTFRAGDIDFSSQLTKIRSANPDVIYVPGYYTEVTLIARKARELGIKVPMLGGDGWTSPTLIQRAGGALDGCFFSDHYSVESESPKVKKYVASFISKYKQEPNSLSALGYDALWILAKAMERSPDLSPSKIRDAIADTKDYPGVTGKITINQDRNAVKSAVVLQIKNGKISYHSTVEPPK